MELPEESVVCETLGGAHAEECGLRITVHPRPAGPGMGAQVSLRQWRLGATGFPGMARIVGGGLPTPRRWTSGRDAGRPYADRRERQREWRIVVGGIQIAPLS